MSFASLCSLLQIDFSLSMLPQSIFLALETVEVSIVLNTYQIFRILWVAFVFIGQCSDWCIIRYNAGCNNRTDSFKNLMFHFLKKLNFEEKVLRFDQNEFPSGFSRLTNDKWEVRLGIPSMKRLELFQNLED